MPPFLLLRRDRIPTSALPTLRPLPPHRMRVLLLRISPNAIRVSLRPLAPNFIRVDPSALPSSPPTPSPKASRSKRLPQGRFFVVFSIILHFGFCILDFLLYLCTRKSVLLCVKFFLHRSLWRFYVRAVPCASPNIASVSASVWTTHGVRK